MPKRKRKPVITFWAHIDVHYHQPGVGNATHSFTHINVNLAGIKDRCNRLVMEYKHAGLTISKIAIRYGKPEVQETVYSQT